MGSYTRAMTDDEKREIKHAFEKAVNLSRRDLKAWLETHESRSVGWAGGRAKRGQEGPESVGHRSGRRILEIRAKTPPELLDEDYAHMRKVVGYVRRHLAQRPRGDVTDTRWRWSLMNWGHDPLKR